MRAFDANWFGMCSCHRKWIPLEIYVRWFDTCPSHSSICIWIRTRQVVELSCYFPFAYSDVKRIDKIYGELHVLHFHRLTTSAASQEHRLCYNYTRINTFRSSCSTIAILLALFAICMRQLLAKPCNRSFPPIQRVCWCNCDICFCSIKVRD